MLHCDPVERSSLVGRQEEVSGVDWASQNPEEKRCMKIAFSSSALYLDV